MNVSCARFAAGLLTAVILAGGCWDRRELDNLGLVLAFGMDTTSNGEIEMTVQIAVPSRIAGGSGGEGGGSSPGPPVMVISKAAPTEEEAFKAIHRSVGRYVTLAQNRVIIFGEETAVKGIGRFLGLFARYREFRRTMLVMVGKGRAKDLLTPVPQLEQNPAEDLLDVVLTAQNMGESRAATLNDLIRNLESDGAAAVGYLLPPAKTKKEESDKSQGGGGGGGQNQDTTGGDKGVRIGGVAVFRGERMVGVYAPAEVTGFLILKNLFKQTFFGIPSGTAREEHLVVRLVSAKPSFEAKIDRGLPSVTIRVKAEADLVAEEGNRNYLKPNSEKLVEEAVRTTLGKRIRNVISRAQQEFNVDPFGIGRHFRPLQPTWSAWQKFAWQNRFAAVPISLRIEVHLRRQGLQLERPIPLPLNKFPPKD